MKESLTMMNAFCVKTIKKWQSYWLMFFMLFIVLSQLVMTTAVASTLSNVHVSNNSSEATVTLGFTGGHPEYRFFPLHNPERLVVDIRQSAGITGLPMRLSGQNLVKIVRTSQPPDAQHKRVVLELAKKATATSVVKQSGNQYQIIFTLKAEGAANSPSIFKENSIPQKSKQSLTGKAAAEVTSVMQETKPVSAHNAPVVKKQINKTAQGKYPIVIAIDAGHGGQDPGAIGLRGLREKNITISVARRLEELLRNDPMFKPVLTRNGDYFISVAGRSEVARKHKANMLVSIHADAAPNRSARGASVWVLSNRRANSELGNWLEQHEKQSELLGGAGDALANGTDPFLSQAVLDLQFGHSQRVGYDVAVKVLQQLSQVGSLHKRTPEHASLGVLRSPDIPSILVETGFISNTSEEELLGSNQYQEKLAQAIHLGLRHYFQANPLQTAPK
ncbi:N-acetylmuramoyl-L-alanine amidase AmiB [Xenorhabdus sp. PB30.3]|uniref:N-acetylmuramoyl-L-alanine amidase AmiB n=2 Tax=Xenorhabdus sp. PB30.3 TaxID=2788941 RepID=UPI001E41706A|nr:N-acetylmuramoyl-L-alanine amidase AmiB [Xenorhabdus sp. PB30.3]MCC8379418.1 N-acetylmuramoyl-L-alanine amidase AmiB [Xenorhabdus sp. PB30.3]